MSDPVQIEPLTEREAEVLAYVADGLTNREIGDRLYLAASTVKWYVTQLNRKLDTANRDELVQRATQLQLLDSVARSTLPQHNMPNPPSLFIGRDQELHELSVLLSNPDVRLLTILALGGMGKTRIAIEAARQQLMSFSEGVYFVPLADFDSVVHAISEHTDFQYRQNDGSNIQKQVLDYLTDKKMLLILDNFEHLLEQATLVNAILEAAPNAKILVTTREKLNLSTENVYPLSGMPYPTWETPDDALEYDSVKLLLQAAKRVKPEWTLSQENLDIVARVCRLTEGMPLGILLAASWLDVFSLEHIATQIQTNIDFLETEMRDVSPRQRSIRAVFESSWNCLSAEEQSVFMKLSVFRGGCTGAAAQAITGAHPRILQALVNKALLSRTQSDRYELHELLRQYGEDRLTQSASAQEAYNVHSAYYCQCLEDKVDDLKGRRQFEALDEIENDHMNFQTAWLWAAKHGHYERLYQSWFSWNLYHFIRGPYMESLPLFAKASEYLHNLPSSSQRDPNLAYVLGMQSLFHSLLNQREQARQCLDESWNLLQDNGTDYDRAVIAYFQAIAYGPRAEQSFPLIDTALSTFRQQDDTWWVGTLLGLRGHFLVQRYELYEGQQQLDAARQVQEPLGDWFGLASTLLWHSFAAERIYNFSEALNHATKSLNYFQQLRARYFIYQALEVLGLFAVEVGNFEMSRQHYTESFALARKGGNQSHTMRASFELAYVALAQGAYDEATELIEAASNFFEVDDPVFSSVVLVRAGEIALAQNEDDKARASFERALHYAESNDSGLFVMFCQRGLGRIAHREGFYDRAKEYLDNARESLRAYERSNPVAGLYKQTELATVLTALADLALSTDEFESAENYVHEAFEVTRDSARIPVTLSVIACAASVFSAQGQLERAAELAAWVADHPKAFAVDKDRVAPLLEQLEEELGTKVFRGSCERGRKLGMESVADYLGTE